MKWTYEKYGRVRLTGRAVAVIIIVGVTLATLVETLT